MQFKISKELLEQIEQLIHAKNDNELEILLNDLHHADIAEILDELDQIMARLEAEDGVLQAFWNASAED